MTKHPSRKVMNFRHLLGCDTIVPAWPAMGRTQWNTWVGLARSFPILPCFDRTHRNCVEFFSLWEVYFWRKNNFVLASQSLGPHRQKSHFFENFVQQVENKSESKWCLTVHRFSVQIPASGVNDKSHFSKLRPADPDRVSGTRSKFPDLIENGQKSHFLQGFSDSEPGQHFV